MKKPKTRRQPRQAGVATVEFGLVALVFFTLLLSAMELGRAMYLWNTVQEVTRHAARDAAITDFTDTAAMNAVRWNAVFRTSAGPLMAAGEITDASVAISYLNANLDPVDTSTTCPSLNISTCLSDPSNSSCIRFVQAQICQPGSGQTSACVPVNYSPMVGLFSMLGIPIPTSTVVMPAESLGFRPSASPC
ncbi:MAG: TadE/TadG family type IV pilus assembly protein [Rhodocyclaceae bacterium]|nr:TadE/TadG family type IV pilus assembly protein [Rhodocyclaceae bacterium]